MPSHSLGGRKSNGFRGLPAAGLRPTTSLAAKAKSRKLDNETCRSEPGQDGTIKNAGYKGIISTEKPITLSIAACVMTREGVGGPAETDDFGFPAQRLTTRFTKWQISFSVC